MIKNVWESHYTTHNFIFIIEDNSVEYVQAVKSFYGQDLLVSQ